MAEPIFFSVLVPIYNVSRWLRPCLDSILNQGWERLELLAVDDGSTDDCGKICDEYAERDKRVRVFHKPNGGLMSARRYGIERAKGDYSLFVDADDMLLPGALETLSRAVADSGADLILYGLTRELPEGTLHVRCPEAMCGRVLTDRRALLNYVLHDSTCNNLVRKCVRSSCFDGRDFTPWFHVSRGEDLLQSTEIYENARSFYFLPDELYFYRLNSASITRSIDFDRYKADFTLERFVYDWLTRLGIFDAADLARWRDHLLDELVIELKRICRFCSDKAHIKSAMDGIRRADFYREFLSAGYSGGGGGPRRALNRLACSLFSHGRDDALILFCAKIYRGR